MKIASIVGARPQFIKIAPLARAIDSHNARRRVTIEHVIVHTGQHYDTNMSNVFFSELDIPPATFNLNVGSGRHGWQTSQMLHKIEEVLIETRPNMVVTYGDTNSTVAGVLAAAKLQFCVSHIEAGLRSFNRTMPEEINRVVADHVADILFAPTPAAMRNLREEGLAAKSRLSGDIMYDAILYAQTLAGQKSKILERLGLEPQSYGVVTLHRAENTDDENNLANLLTALNRVAKSQLPLIFPLHPRTGKAILEKLPNWRPHERLRVTEPMGYLDMIRLVESARVILTDSGGLQKEAVFLHCPCVTLRQETEWVETLELGVNIVAGTEPGRIEAAVAEWQERIRMGPVAFGSGVAAAFGEGRSAEHILLCLMDQHCSSANIRSAYAV
jgi:UDP-N-acetylglucosamine 2-epimerase